ncbi:protein-methionine sulfoxide oxidase MICAL3 [Striga asiatica]|uniref:Protein-methionine sulfoxide oxidase MICAL3 n=1 Tax=Striga asiatica TaxID=4170 RepID=A0A5A7NVK5_STRAF|nr:protein-methionine sulfoxide oxidase MICAL3 [Striga asiatica]
MQPHRQFFTSLKQLEKRLKLENHHHPPPAASPPPPPPLPAAAATDPITTAPQSESLGTPIYINPIPAASTNPQDSEAPHEFLSESSDPPHHDNQPDVDKTAGPAEKSSLDHDIDRLMQLLRLSETGEKEGACDVGCDDWFCRKIVGAKGPKSAEESERLEGWIRWCMEGEIKEPFGLVHLLLGKASFVQSGDYDECGGFGGFVFPSTIDEFLGNDPPVE